MGQIARNQIGLKDVTWEKWKIIQNCKKLHLSMWIDILYKDLKSDIEKYDGTFLNGWSITESGIIAMAHNVGSAATKQFLYSGGKMYQKMVVVKMLHVF